MNCVEKKHGRVVCVVCSRMILRVSAIASVVVVIAGAAIVECLGIVFAEAENGFIIATPLSLVVIRLTGVVRESRSIFLSESVDTTYSVAVSYGIA